MQKTAAATFSEKDVEPAGRPVLIGWFCLDLVSGRPAVHPLFAATEGWASTELNRMVESRRARRFSIWGFTGRRVGSLTVAGAHRVEGGAAAAVGSYVGGAPCSKATRIGEEVEEDLVCRAVHKGCGLATAALEAAGGIAARPYEEVPDLPSMKIAGACVSNGSLLVDIDNDGKVEHFGVAPLVDGLVPPAELVLQEDVGSSCEPTFTAPLGETGRWIVGVGDLDEDGRNEIVVRDGDQGFWLYAAPSSPARLELVARSQGLR